MQGKVQDKKLSSYCRGVNRTVTSKYYTLQHLWGVKILTYKEKYSYGASYRVKTDKFHCTLMRDTDVIHFTEIS